MFKRYFFTGLAAGILSGLAAFFYARIYTMSTGADYPRIVSAASIFSACIFAGMLIAMCCYGIATLFKKDMEVLTGFLITGASLISMCIPFMISLPLDVEHPELFPGLVVPMQLFPALAWFGIRKLIMAK